MYGIGYRVHASEDVCVTLFCFRGMGHTSTVNQLFMRGSGLRTVGMVGER